MSSTPSTVTGSSTPIDDVEAQLKSIPVSATPTLCGDCDEQKDTMSLKLELAHPVTNQDQELSSLRKNLILAVLSGAQFFDIFNACAAIIALPAVSTVVYSSASFVCLTLPSF